MISKPLTLIVVSAALTACAHEDADTIGYVERLDPALDALGPPDAVFEVLADGHEWTEGPVWVPALHSVLYSDIPKNAIYRWTEGAEASVWLTPSGYTSGAARTWARS